ncbi:ran-binding protein 3 [Euwallacea fornicatus]|uniref:ran-binding protein 3 n=1 Tax=Euwallacea fornicatus TaxID=995702 RepID=UPI00338E17B9
MLKQREISKMAEATSDEALPSNRDVKMKVDEPGEHLPSNHDNSTNKTVKNDEFTICSPSTPFSTMSTNPLACRDHNNVGKSILKPSLLSFNSTSSSNVSVLRLSSLNPFNKSNDDNYVANNHDKKQSNGDVLKFVPLLKSEPKLLKTTEATCNSNDVSTTSSKTSFVFGQNLQDRVLSDAKSSEPLPSTSSLNSNGSTSDMLFSSAIKSDSKPEPSKEKETKTLTESAREYEESRANKRKYDEVQVRTGEEEETNILSISCKLFSFDKASSNWQERGRGTLRLNDFEVERNQMGSRLVFRTSGSLRVIINTKVWAEMTIDKASEKSIRLTALDSSGEVKVFLIMSSIEDSKQLYSHLQSRLEKEISLQKRKKHVAENSGGK